MAPKAGAAGLAAPKSPPPAGWAAPNAVLPVGIMFIKMSINSSIDSSFFRTDDLTQFLSGQYVKACFTNYKKSIMMFLKIK